MGLDMRFLGGKSRKKAAQISFGFEGHPKYVYVLSVADAFELAVELGGGVVWVAVFGFGLALI
ncbi:hypothetical protein RBB79_01665 [Tunturiibacter empetritectus]|uniref:Uncharacterized protein n=1 Tax=Tunturiibacter lichenicola TaxID=2051959 RepID=A0A852V585_9BACT|nr:hypothetical protein [Edaphobacter lichenicola]NYF88198.1 hypothetical protein [Edaphobacter lichenicola]